MFEIVLLIRAFFNQIIDFSSLDLNAEIDFGEVLDLKTAGDEIDWGDVDTEENEEELTAVNDILLEESGIMVESAGYQGGTVTGTEAYTVLDNPATRSEFINQLFEVRINVNVRVIRCKYKIDHRRSSQVFINRAKRFIRSWKRS